MVDFLLLNGQFSFFFSFLNSSLCHLNLLRISWEVGNRSILLLLVYHSAFDNVVYFMIPIINSFRPYFRVIMLLSLLEMNYPLMSSSVHSPSVKWHQSFYSQSGLIKIVIFFVLCNAFVMGKWSSGMLNKTTAKDFIIMRH